MTLSEAAARLHQQANGTVSGEEMRAMARDLYGKATDRELVRLLNDAGYMLIARAEGSRLALDSAFLPRLRRDFAGPLTMDGVDLLQGPDVVAIEDRGSRWYVAPRGAVMSLNQWLIVQMAPEPAAAG